MDALQDAILGSDISISLFFQKPLQDPCLRIYIAASINLDYPQRALKDTDAATYMGKYLKMNPEKWILQSFLKYIWMLKQESRKMDFVKNSEKYMDFYLRIRSHGSCGGAWDVCGCWDIYPETWRWNLRMTLKYIYLDAYGSRDWIL